MGDTMRYGEKEIANARLEPWPNPSKDRDYTIEITFPEFTCLCPRSGYPDFATMRFEYVPDEFIVELKSLKLYLNSYRSLHISHEEAANRIFQDFVEAIKPRRLKLTADFHPRGNVHTIIRIEL